MLRLISDSKKAQADLEHNLKKVLQRREKHNIGFPGGNFDRTINIDDESLMWAVFGGLSKNSAVPRYLNSFGFFRADKSQDIVVEINVPAASNTRQVSGFFAEDAESGDTFLVHSGKIGGGRLGIGKSAFLTWSKAKVVDVREPGGGIRKGIPICRLNDPALPSRVLWFVKSVRDFKNHAANGKFNAADFKRQVEEFDRYNAEFFGTKKGSHKGNFEYVTYHGEIVQKLFEARTNKKMPDEIVGNSTKIDLFVKRNGVLTEVYEVKTGVGRQVLYLALGQLLVHAATDSAIAKFLIIPYGEALPKDIEQAISAYNIQVRRFHIEERGSNRLVRLSGEP